MLLADLLTLLSRAETALENHRTRGFRVTWGLYDGTGIERDFTPAKGEPPLADEAEAWALAQRMAGVAEFVAKQVGRRLVDIYVVDASGAPVASAGKRMLLPWLGQTEPLREQAGSGALAPR